MSRHDRHSPIARLSHDSPSAVIDAPRWHQGINAIFTIRFTAVFVLFVAISFLNIRDARAYSFEVRVTIDGLLAQVSFDDNSGTDFYAEVTIDGTTTNNYGTVGQQALEGMDSITPGLLNAGRSDWSFTKLVDPTEGTVPITIKVFDDDDGFNFGDDQADIENGPGTNIDITLDLKTCTFNGELSGTCGASVSSTGNGEADGNATIEFTVDIVGFNQSGGVHVHCIHDPIWPQPGEQVKITAVALGDNLEPRIVDQISITQGTSSAVLEETDTPFASYTAGPFNDPDFNYSCTALNDEDNDGNIDGDEAAFSGYRTVSVGIPAGSQAVPVIQTGPEDQRRDVILIPDSAYSGPMDSVFLQDAKNMIDLYYLSGLVLLDNQDQVNFWIAQDPGSAGGYVPPTCNRVAPSNWATDYSFSDAAAILHRKELRDCAKDGIASASTVDFDANHVLIPFKPTVGFSPFVHELGHALYGLADEYCGTRAGANPSNSCDGGYWQATSNPNVFDNSADCEADRATDPDGATKTCQEFVSTNEDTMDQHFWTFDPPANDYMVDNKFPRFLDIRRICAVLTGSPNCM